MKLTGKIIGAALEVHKLLGPGFVESIDHRALLHELNLRGLRTRTELQIDITIKAISLANIASILLLKTTVMIIELKAVNGILDVHIAQAISYLKATGLELARLFNFGQPRPSWKRLIKSRESRELRELF